MYESENPTALQIARERHDNAMDAMDAVDSGDYGKDISEDYCPDGSTLEFDVLGKFDTVDFD